MSRRLTFPLPARYAEQTASKEVTVSVWRGKDQPRQVVGIGGTQQSRFECELVREEVVKAQPLFVTRPWELGDVMTALMGGGWFAFEVTDFDARSTSAFAREAQATRDLLWGGA